MNRLPELLGADTNRYLLVESISTLEANPSAFTMFPAIPGEEIVIVCVFTKVPVLVLAYTYTAPSPFAYPGAATATTEPSDDPAMLVPNLSPQVLDDTV